MGYRASLKAVSLAQAQAQAQVEAKREFVLIFSSSFFFWNNQDGVILKCKRVKSKSMGSYVCVDADEPICLRIEAELTTTILRVQSCHQ